MVSVVEKCFKRFSSIQPKLDLRNWLHQKRHFMPFVDRNSHLTNKPYKFDIKCRCTSEGHEQHVLRPSLRVVKKFSLGREVFFKQERVSTQILTRPSLNTNIYEKNHQNNCLVYPINLSYRGFSFSIFVISSYYTIM